MYCHKTGLGAQCAHPEPRSRTQCPCRGCCCAHSKLVAHMSRAQPAHVTRSGRGRMSRPSGQPSQVPTSIPCRDLPSAPPKKPRSRPQKMGSRHQLPWGSQNHVATSNQCRDITRPIQVATPKPGRDPPGGYSMSRHHFYVATSFLPIVGFPGRDAQLQVVTSHTATMSRPQNDVATSNQLSPISATSRSHFFLS